MARLRTFIAVDVGEAVRGRCIAMQQTLARAGVDVKWVEPENMHITLLFLGEVDERDVIDVCRSVAEVCAKRTAFPLSVEGVGTFPESGKPRVVWAGLGIGASELVDLYAALEAPLLELGCYRREERPYNPHLTLGRVKADSDTRGVGKVLEKQANWKAGETEIREVQVMSSVLQPSGPVYAVLSRAKLRPREG